MYERMLVQVLARRNGHQLAPILYKRDTWRVITTNSRRIQVTRLKPYKLDTGKLKTS